MDAKFIVFLSHKIFAATFFFFFLFSSVSEFFQMFIWKLVHQI